MAGAVEISRPLLRVVGPADMRAQEQAADQKRADDASKQNATDLSDLAGFVRTQFQMFKMHRDRTNGGWSHRLLEALNAFNGQYDADKLAAIKKFGGSEVYARVTAMKCRGASSLLRDVYLSPDRPWGLDPDEDPKIPDAIIAAIHQLLSTEMQGLQASGAPMDMNAVNDRAAQLLEAARQAAKRKAADQARVSEDKINQILIEGGFYRALAEFLVDIPLFPFAVIKGPVVRIVPAVSWVGGKATTDARPRMFWNRVSPFDVWWTPGVSDIEDAAVIERSRLTRADLNELLDLPGYNTKAIREILDIYGTGGLNDNWDMTDAERAVLENRENPIYNQSGLISCLEYHGSVQGRLLLQHGMTKEQIPDEMRDYFVQLWMIDRYIIKAQLSPSPRKRHPYFITSFEKVPGTPVGNGLPDILADIQDVCNSTLRSLVNNLSIASGPQVVVNDDRLADDEDGEDLYPWKRWHITRDPLNNNSGSEKPVDFFQPQSNAQEHMSVFQTFSQMADDHSAIPRFMEGGSAGGAGRTSSGLAMLMGNASKILQTVAANIDRDVIDGILTSLFDMIMLTDESGLLTGEEKIRVMGVNVAVQKETQRSRQLEFLQATANPIDMQIIGPIGRAEVLRSVADTIGLPGKQIVPTEDTLQQQQKVAAAAAQQQNIPGHGGMGPQAAAAQGNQPSKPNGDQGPRTNIAGGVS